MEILNLIDKKTLIICPNSYKKAILSEMNKNKHLYNVSFMSLSEYLKKYLFDYNVKTIYYLTSKYKMKVSNAISLINNLYYIDDKKYISDKLNYLVNIKHELDSENLLLYDKVFKKYLESVKIIVYGYGKLDKFNLSILENATILEEDSPKKNIDVYEFNNISEEVEFVFNKIEDLLLEGVSINNIKLFNVTSEYLPYLKRFSYYYNLNISLPSDKVIGTSIIQEFLGYIKNGYPKEEIITFLDKYKTNNLYNIVINLLNKYYEFDDLRVVYDLIYDDLLKMNKPKEEFLNTISLISINDFINADDYVFLMGFNNGNIPLHKDEDYITDNIKEEVIMSDTNELNMLSNINMLNKLNSINNLIISYKYKTPFNTYFVSNLIDNLDVTIKKVKGSYQYSSIYNKLKYADKLDNYIKYGEYDEDLGLLHYNYQDIPYNTYDNKYHKIDKDLLLKYLNNELILSYSSINNYYKCSFRYYLANVLKIDVYEETFDTIIGNIFHYVLSVAFNDNFNFEEVFNYAIKDYCFSYKEKYFISKLKNDLLFVINTIKEYQKNTGLTKELYEKKILIKLMDKPYVVFKGFVDKIMLKESNDTSNIAIIDYKTGNPNIKLDYLKYGLSMQLPSYLYLVSNSGLFKNIKYCGFYLQHILNNEIKLCKGKSYLDMKKDNLKLCGYSTDDVYRLSMFDDSYEDSMMIKGMKTKKDGALISTAKVLDDDAIDEVISICKQKIEDALKDILMAKFTINPKVIDNVNVGCEYCNFKDICYVKEDDKVYLESEVE